LDIIFQYVLAFISYAAVAALVFLVHESGHYITAVLCRVRVDSVTVGFGREVWAKTDRSGTRWSVRLFPVCGLVHLHGEEGKAHDPRGFAAQKLWKRILIVAAGPIANLLLAFMALTLFYTAAGRVVAPPIVSGVEIGMPADKAGLQPGDVITTFDGSPVTSYYDIVHVIENENGSRSIPFTVRRNGKEIDLRVRPEWTTYNDMNGFARAHGRSGILVVHRPMLLANFMSVGGVDTHGDPVRVRRLLRKALGGTFALGIKVYDGKTHIFRVHPLGAVNKGLADPNSPDYDWVYLGPLTDNIYLIEKPVENMKQALRETARLASGIVQMMGRMSQIDRQLLIPEDNVRPSHAPVKYYFFSEVHDIVILSLFLALFNLLPMPWADGGFLIVFLFEIFAGRERIEVLAPYIRRLAFLLLISVWLLINTPLLAVFVRL
jgi:regulator of sigma E protease